MPEELKQVTSCLVLLGNVGCVCILDTKKKCTKTSFNSHTCLENTSLNQKIYYMYFRNTVFLTNLFFTSLRVIIHYIVILFAQNKVWCLESTFMICTEAATYNFPQQSCCSCVQHHFCAEQVCLITKLMAVFLYFLVIVLFSTAGQWKLKKKEEIQKGMAS